MNDRLFIFDTTLRDGEQSPGASMTAAEKIRIARQLEKLKVDIIEAGFPQPVRVIQTRSSWSPKRFVRVESAAWPEQILATLKKRLRRSRVRMHRGFTPSLPLPQSI